MKIISWNVAGFRACLKKGFEEFFYKENADIYCLQESKVTKEQYSFHPENYYEYLFPAEKKGYSGTLVYSKIKPLNVIYGIGESIFDKEGRTITIEYSNFYLVNSYVPNVKRDLSRMEERMYFEDKLRSFLKNLEKTKPVIICGDFNVAHNEIDIKNFKANIGNAGFTYEERRKFNQLLDSGFIDTFRYFNKDLKDAYTWWSYRKGVRERNIGWRIDYFLTSKDIINHVDNTTIYKNILGSDHCPIGLGINM
ncbi:MAG: exodeoxyribonuclease III [Bacilli bacterium]|nr:exodeoxyribonuclease III [Bacilli bacterium]